jgi:Autographiviridae endonuclease VII
MLHLLEKDYSLCYNKNAEGFGRFYLPVKSRGLSNVPPLSKVWQTINYGFLFGVDMKKCSACGVEKDNSEFHKNPGSRDGLNSSCKSCKSAYNRWLAKNPVEIRKYKNGKLKKRTIRTDVCKKYGITSDNYDELLESQNGVCAICGGHPKGKKRRLCIDHDHNTGKIRGLLCNECNVALGAAKDSESVLVRMINYLRGVK